MKTLLTGRLVLLLTVFAFPAAAQEQETDDKKPQKRGLPVQPGDDVPKPLDKPLPEDVRKRIEAQSWFMAGKVEQRAGRDAKAYEAFQKALELDPAAVPIYRELIPLAFKLRRANEAAEFARKAVELDPNDYEILQQLAIISAGTERLQEAIGYIEQALKSNRLKKQSLEALILNRDLIRFCSLAGDLPRAADGCDVLFDALKNPARYNLDARAQRILSQQYDLVGQVFVAAGRPERAIEVFKEQARVKGDRPGTHNFRLAQLYFSMKDYKEAESQVTTFFETRPRTRDPYLLFAAILRADGREAELIERLEGFAGKDARNAKLQYFLADQYVAADRLDEAEDLLKKALRGSGDPEGYLGLSGVYRRRRAAEPLLDALVKAMRAEVDPAAELAAISTDTELLDKLMSVGRKLLNADVPQLGFEGSFLLGRLASAVERSEDAVVFLRAALQTSSAEQLGQVSLELGRQLLFDDQFAEAVEVFENALAAIGNRAGPDRQQRVLLLYRLSQAHAYMDENESALSALRQAQRIIPDLPMLHYQEAWVYFHSRQTDKAENKLQDVIRRYESDIETVRSSRLLLASVRSQQRRFEEAIEAFEALVRDYPDHDFTVRSARMSLSNLYIATGDVPRAENILEEVLKGDPDDPGVNNDLGYLYADQGKQLERAERMIRKAVESAPDNAAYLDSMGWVLFRREKYAEAAEYLERAIALPDPPDSTILEHLGDCYEKLSKPERARKLWQQAFDVESEAPYPDEEVTTRLREKLDGADESQALRRDAGSRLLAPAGTPVVVV